MIYLTSPLHDIGKVAIPDHVLLKPGRLSDREFEIMKTHTTLGARTLEAALKEHPEAELPPHGSRHRRHPPRTMGRHRLPQRPEGRSRSPCAAGWSRWPTCTTP